MVTSGEVIKYVKSSVNDKDIVSMFVAGSLPDKLIPKSDLDIIFVVKDSRKNHFFNNLSKAMNRFVERHPKVTYSFFRELESSYS